MEIWALASPVLAALLVQLVKDRLKLKGNTLKYSGSLLGAASSVIIALADGNQSGVEVALLGFLGLVIPAGVHQKLLQNSKFGHILQALGTILQKKGA